MSAGWTQLAESKMAIAMAEAESELYIKIRLLKEQAKEVDRVKRQENGVITDNNFYHK